MYSTQRLYFRDVSFLEVLQRAASTVAGVFKVLDQSVDASRAAQRNPADRETLLAIFSEE